MSLAFFSALFLLLLLLLPPPSLPSPIPSLSTLSSPPLTLHVLGTAHVSSCSSDAVARAFEQLEPDAVCLELCHERAPGLLAALPGVASERVPGAGRPPLLLSLISSLQSRYAAGQNVTVGADFLAALDHCHRSASPPPVLLLDRPLSLTVSRLTSSLSPFSKLRLVLSLLLQSLLSPFLAGRTRRYLAAALADGSLVERELAKLAKSLPRVHEVLVKERDEYLAAKLLQACERVREERGGAPVVVLAVLGKGHQAAVLRRVEAGLGQGRAPPVRGALLEESFKGGGGGGRYTEEERRHLAEEIVLCEMPPPPDRSAAPPA
ncbi:hypothetical protein TeGR_g3578 [Tetraparma gracilis]|uniref:Uncharacterized protein n=1 Tax=Tetraparma gracilis TaxID=2962635 RepID=A0ABQ6MU49_9STRA|nr:hypothetical protein TeGR_g3578 [Tetraparma gracilis]